MAVLICIPTGSVQRFSFISILSQQELPFFFLRKANITGMIQFWFSFPDDKWCWAFFYVPVGHLHFFHWEMCLDLFSIFNWIIIIIVIVIAVELFEYLCVAYKPLDRYTAWKYFFLIIVSCVFILLINSFIIKKLLVWWIPIVYFWFCFLWFWCWTKNSYQSQCSEVFPLCSSKVVPKLQNLASRFLLDFVSVFVPGEKYSPVPSFCTQLCSFPMITLCRLLFFQYVFIGCRYTSWLLGCICCSIWAMDMFLCQ